MRKYDFYVYNAQNISEILLKLLYVILTYAVYIGKIYIQTDRIICKI